MGLETATSIGALNALWPLGTDPRSQGDDHLRLIKKVLQVDVPSLALTTTQTFKGPLRVPDGDAADPGLQFDSVNNGIFWLPGSGPRFVAAGAVVGALDGTTALSTDNSVVTRKNGDARYVQLSGAEPMTGGLVIGDISSADVTTATGAGIFTVPTGQISVLRNNANCLSLRRSGSDGAVAFFARGTALVGSIGVTASGTSFNTTSDRRIKRIDGPAQGQLAAVSSVPVYEGAFLSAPDDPRVVMLADELSAAAPWAVTGEPDGEDLQMVDYAQLVPTLWAAVQELALRLDLLEAPGDGAAA